MLISKEMSSLYFGLDVFCLFEARSEMRYCEVSKEMSSEFGLDVFCKFEAQVPESDQSPNS